jgi:hypothetical protein
METASERFGRLEREAVHRKKVLASIKRETNKHAT